MVGNIQYAPFNVVYDYATYLVENMHKHLVEIKGGKNWVKLWRYSLLMYMILCKKEKYFGEDMSLKKVDGDIELPIQCWNQILDMDD